MVCKEGSQPSPCCKERFYEYYLFASKFTSIFQIFALTMFSNYSQFALIFALIFQLVLIVLSFQLLSQVRLSNIIVESEQCSLTDKTNCSLLFSIFQLCTFYFNVDLSNKN